MPTSAATDKASVSERSEEEVSEGEELGITYSEEKSKESSIESTTKSTNDTKGKNEDALEDLSRKIEVLDLTDEIGIHEDVFKVAQWIRESSRIMVLSGAGVSCSAGIPDFRTPGTGLYDNLQKYNLPYPEAVFDLSFYKRNPQPFCSLAKEIWPGVKHSPTLTHSFLALLANRSKLLRNYSQNIDGLEYLAKIPSEQIMECHGHFRTASCTKCGKPFDGDECKRIMLEKGSKESPPPECQSCGGYVKPDIVFFGEGLPERYGRLLQRDLGQADLLLIIGTSLSVAPVSMVPHMVSKKCKRVLINRESVGNLNAKRRDDAELLGDCDDTVKQLARVLKWQEELVELNESTKIKPKGSKN